MLNPLQIANLRLSAHSFLKIPLLFFCRPKIIEMNERRTEIRIKLSRRTKNHLNSMYFGVLAVGADVAGGLACYDKIMKSQKNVSLIFKDFKADFLKRPEGDVHFICEDGLEVDRLLEETITTGERVEYPLNIIAVVPSISDEVVAKFVLTLSLKYKPKK